MQTIHPVHIYLTPSLLGTLSPHSPNGYPCHSVSTQFADIYNIPLFIIKEDHLGERNSSLLMQPVQDTARVTTLAS